MCKGAAAIAIQWRTSLDLAHEWIGILGLLHQRQTCATPSAPNLPCCVPEPVSYRNEPFTLLPAPFLAAYPAEPPDQTDPSRNYHSRHRDY